VARIVRAAVAAVAVPVTVKIRSGYSPARRNGVEIARIAEAEGASAVTVHGRTRACRFLGQAEHDTVASIKAALTIPVFANGDISDAATAADILAATRVDGIMIGREAYHRPLFLSELMASLHQRPATDVWTVMAAYQEYIDRELASGTRLHDMTRHCLGIFSGFRGARRFRQLLSDASRLRSNDPGLVAEAVAGVAQQAA